MEQGGPRLASEGVRAVPSLTYLERQPNFSIGPDNDEDETVSLAQLAALGRTATRATKTAVGTAASAANLVPQGGLLWDGRADTLQAQAAIPLLTPFEMDNGSVALAGGEARAGALRGDDEGALRAVDLRRSAHGGCRGDVRPGPLSRSRSRSFHPFTSKYDFWLEGKARLSPAELRGYLLFNDPHKANCGGCHLDQPGADGLPPLFTDDQYEALGVPRNRPLAVDRDPGFFDLGVCGPLRTDIAAETQYCGMFLTPTLRNVTTTPRVLPQRRLSYACSRSWIFITFGIPIPRRSIRGQETATWKSTTTCRRTIAAMSTQSIRRSTGCRARRRR